MPPRDEFRKALLAFFVVALLAMPRMLLGEVYLPTAGVNECYPWRYLSAGTQLSLEPPITPCLGDSYRIFHPVDCYLHHWLQRGQVPVWDHLIMCGRPLLASGSQALAYPPKLLFIGLLGPGWGHNLFLFFHLWATGVLAYLFFRLWGSPGAAFVGGLVWMLNGFQSVYLENKCVIAITPWIAWSFLEAELLLRSARVVHALRLGLALGLGVLAGQLQLVLYGNLFLGAYCLTRVSLGRQPKRLIALLMVSGALGILWSAPQWMPTLELVKLAGRPTLTLEQQLNANRVFPENLVCLVLPEFLGSRQGQFYLTRFASNVQTPLELTGHAGMLATQLALLGLVEGWRRRFVRFHAAAAAVVLLVVTGTPLLDLMYRLPILNKFTYTRLLMIFPWCIAALAVVGWDELCRGRQRSRWPAAVPLIAASLAWGWACWEVQSRSALFQSWMSTWRDNGVLLSYCTSYKPLQAFRAMVESNIAAFYTPTNLIAMLPLLLGAGLVAWLPGRRPAALLAGLVAFELLVFAWRWNPTGKLSDLHPDLPSLRYLSTSPRVASLGSGPLPNMYASQGIPDAGGYESLYPQAYRGLFSRIQGSEPVGYHVLILTRLADDFERWANLASIHHLVSHPLSVPEGIPASWKRIEFPELTIYENPQPSGRARFPRGVRGRVEWIEDTPCRIVLEVEVERDERLITSDQNYPGWECWVDGRQVAVETVNFCFRSAMIPAGRHRVEWRFRSPTLLRGLWLAGLAALVSLLGWAGQGRLQTERRVDADGV